MTNNKRQNAVDILMHIAFSAYNEVTLVAAMDSLETLGVTRDEILSYKNRYLDD